MGKGRGIGGNRTGAQVGRKLGTERRGSGSLGFRTLGVRDTEIQVVLGLGSSSLGVREIRAQRLGQGIWGLGD